MARILLVEDNETNAEMLERRLARRGFQVVTATDGLQAIDRAQADQPDLILMDMSLPGLDGWDATRRLKAHPATSHIPIIALTAHSWLSDRDRALKAGCDEFESKPVAIDRLTQKMDDLLKARAAHD